MKRIAIFCDGTWNRADQRHPTNVFGMSSAIAGKDNGTRQEAIYIEGVGTGSDGDSLKGRLRWLLGGVFGYGLMRNIADGYRALADTYEPGDEIYLFGFSRGAFTARSLAGMVRYVGLPGPGQRDRIGRAVDRYRRRSRIGHPDTIANLQFRRRYAPHLVTSREEGQWRHLRGDPERPALRIAYVGVWDTVGALGVPSQLSQFKIGSLINRRFQFHDTRLSRSAVAARHAVAIDERRKNFEPTLWINLAELNGTDGGLSYVQQWFPGDHGAVGGGGDRKHLSALALAWIAEGASAQGLKFTSGALDRLTAPGDPLGPLVSNSLPPGPMRRFLERFACDRAGPAEAADVSQIARTRYGSPRHAELYGTPYRPAPLGRLAAALDRLAGAG